MVAATWVLQALPSRIVVVHRFLVRLSPTRIRFRIRDAFVVLS